MAIATADLATARVIFTDPRSSPEQIAAARLAPWRRLDDDCCHPGMQHLEELRDALGH